MWLIMKMSKTKNKREKSLQYDPELTAIVMGMGSFENWLLEQSHEKVNEVE